MISDKRRIFNESLLPSGKGDNKKGQSRPAPKKELKNESR